MIEKAFLVIGIHELLHKLPFASQLKVNHHQRNYQSRAHHHEVSHKKARIATEYRRGVPTARASAWQVRSREMAR
jgi:hypothetical protein